MRGRLAAILTVTLFLAPLAHAQTTADGSVRGYVKDEQGGVLPGVTLTATSSTVGGVRTTVSDAGGFYRLLDLRPGDYVITAELEGFARLVRENISVRAGLNLGLDIVMKIGPMAETVEVVAETPMLEVAKATQSLNTAGELQRQIPLMANRNFASFFFLTPGVVSEEGGSHFVHGATYDSQVLQVDGADLTSNLQAVTWYVQFSTEAIEDVEVKTAAVDASAPLTQGAVINMVTKSGGNQFHGATGALFSAKAWSTSNEPGGAAPGISLFQPDSSLGGPIVQNRWWFFGSHRYTRERTTPSATADDLAMMAALVPGWTLVDMERGGNYYFGKTTAQLSPKHQISAFYQYDRNPTLGMAGRQEKPFTEFFQGGAAYGGRLSSVWSSSLMTRLSVSYNDKTAGAEGSFRPFTSVQVHKGVNKSGAVLVGTGLVAELENTTWSSYAEPYNRLVLSGDVTWYRRSLLGSHELQAGFYLQPKLHSQFTYQYNNQGFNVEEVVLKSATDPASGYTPFHRVVYDAPEATTLNIDSDDYAFYVQDSWRPTSRLTIGAGVRVNLMKETDNLFDLVVKDNHAIGPRFSANYQVTSSGVFRASWGRVHESLNFGRSSAGSSAVGLHNYYDTNLDGVFETDLYTPGATRVAQDRIIDVKRGQPYVNEFTLGHRHQLPGRIVLDVGLVSRQFRDSPVSYDTNGIYENGVFKGYQNENFNAINRVTVNDWNHITTTDLTLAATKQGKQFQFVTSYTRNWRHLAGTWVPNDPASFIQPDAFPNDKGLSEARATENNSLSGSAGTNTRPWVDHAFRLGVTYLAPYGITAAANYQVQSGIYSGPIVTRIAASDPAFGPTTVRLSNGRVVANPLATTVRLAYSTRGDGQLQLPLRHLLNLRIGHRLTLGWGRLETAVEVFNPFNWDRFNWYEMGGNQTYSTYYGKGRYRQSPRSGQVSVRFVF